MNEIQICELIWSIELGNKSRFRIFSRLEVSTVLETKLESGELKSFKDKNIKSRITCVEGHCIN